MSSYVLAEQLTTGTPDIFYNRDPFSDSRWTAQTFTVPAGVTWDITSIKLKLRRQAGTIQTYWRMQVVDTVTGPYGSGQPGTNEYAHFDIATNGIATDDYYWYEEAISLTGLSPGQYAIVMEPLGTKAGSVAGGWDGVFQGGLPPYAGGKQWYISPIVGGTWLWPANYHCLAFQIWGETITPGPSAPTDPTPADSSGPGVDFSDLTLSWENGGGATKYDVYVGGNLVSEHQSDTSYTTSLEELQTIYGVAPIDQTVEWQINAFDDNELEADGDVWSFDPRPAQSQNPTPVDAATKQRLNLTQLRWEA
jgi:hypothetical protein